MSHFTKVETNIKNEEALKTACTDLGLTLIANTTARGWQGNTMKAPYVVRLPGPYDVALVQNKDGVFEIHADWFGGFVAKEIGQKGGKLLQAYGIASVKLEAQARGMVIEQQTLADGTVRFQLRDSNPTQQLKRR